MTAHTGPGLEAHEAVGLGRRGVDHLPHVDAHPVRQHRQLVDQRDVDRAKDVLEQLGHLGDFRGRDRDHVVADSLVQRDRPIGALGRDAAHHFRGVAQRVVGAARVDTLRREGDVESVADPQAAVFEQRRELFAGRARVRRRLENDELSTLDHGPKRLARRDQRSEIGLAVGRQGRWDADQHRVGPGQRREMGRRLDGSQDRMETFGGDVLDIGPSSLDRRNLAFIDVDRDDLLASLRERDDQRQPHVSEPDYPDAHDITLSSDRDMRTALGCRVRAQKTIVRLPWTMTRSSRWLATARARTTRSRSRPIEAN